MSASRQTDLPGGLLAGGTDGNELLTAEVGVLLFVLLAVLGITILRIGQLLWLHLFLGLLLLGPVVLKMASTGYRFMRYYTHNRAYRSKGPPEPYLRLLAPIVVLSTVAVFATGVALLLLGPSSRGTLLLAHKVTFIVWIMFTALHVLGHLPDVQRTMLNGRTLRSEVLTGASPGRSGRPQSLPTAEPGRSGRALSIAGALLAGLILALLLLPQFEPWLHYHRVFTGH